MRVLYTRDDDTFIELDERPNIANKNDADVFISIHCNAVPSNQNIIYGTETYVMGQHTSEGNFEVTKRENSVILLEENYEERYEGFDPKSPESLILFSLYQNAYINNSLNLADKIEHQFAKQSRQKKSRSKTGWILGALENLHAQCSDRSRLFK